MCGQDSFGEVFHFLHNETFTIFSPTNNVTIILILGQGKSTSSIS